MRCAIPEAAFRRAAGLLLVVLLVAAGASVGRGAATGDVTFPTAAPGEPLTVSGRLSRPDGPGPLPAIVLLHTCSGLAPYNLAYAEWLSRNGYAALVVNSFAPRHQTNVCGSGRNPSVREMAGDALGALAYLRAQPWTDASHVGVMGWSYGAMAALILSRQSFVDAAKPAGGGFRAAVALYPDCRLLASDTSIPLLLLLGGADNWTPPAACEALAPGLQNVEWHTYPGAHHAFDNEGFGNLTVTALGRYTMRYDPAAASQAHTHILDFLAKRLRAP